MPSRIHRLLDRFTLTHRPADRRERRADPGLEALETRLAPATDTWNGAGALASLAHPNDNFSNPQNWVSTVAPRPGDALVFPSGAKTKAANNDFAPGTAFASLSFSGDGYQVTGNPIQLQAGISNTFGFNTVALPLTLSAAQTFTDAYGSGLDLAGAINNGGHLLTVNTSGNVLFTGTSIGGAGGLTLKGDGFSGNLFLQDSAPDSYTGVTTVLDAGVLYLDGAQGDAVVGNLVAGDGPGPIQNDVVRLARDNQIADTSSVTVYADGLLSTNGYNDTIGSLTMQGGYVTTGTGTLTLNGNVTTLAASTTAYIEGNLSLGMGIGPKTFTVASGTAGGDDLGVKATISGGSGAELVKAGAGAMWLSGSDTYFGSTLVSAGTLVTANANALGGATTTVNSGATLEYRDPNADSNYAPGAGPLTLAGGTLLVSGCAPTVVLASPLALAAASTIEVNAGDTLDLTGQVMGTGGFTKTWAGELDLSHANTVTGAVVVADGVMALDNTQALGTSAVKVSAQGSLVLEDGLTCGGSLTLAGTLFANGSATWTGSIALSGSASICAAVGDTLTVSGPISGPAANGLTVGDSKDTGTVLLTATNTYAGPTVVSAGTLAVANPDALGSPGGKTTNNGTTVAAGATLQLRGGLTFDATEALTLNGLGVNGAGALQDGSGNDTWGGTVYLAGSTAIGAAAGTTLTIDGVISGPYASNLSIVGSGTVVLAGADTFLGYTTVTAGVLALANTKALSGAPIYGGRGTTVDAGATLQLRAGGTFALDPVQLNGSGVGGTMGALESLTGDNTWPGPIDLHSDATITSAAGSTFTTGAAITNEGYMLTVDAIGNVDFPRIICGAGGLTKDGSGTLTLSGGAPILYSGPTIINAGTLMLAKPSWVPAITGAGVTVNAGGTLAGSGTIDADVINSGVVSPGSPTGTGTLTINSNYTQTASGILDMGLESAKAIDAVMISGAAALDGTLNVAMLDGFVPAPGDLFAIMSFGSSSGRFATVNLPPGLGIVCGPHDVTIDLGATTPGRS
jgi:autotransporter-associated beta strand protein